MIIHNITDGSVIDLGEAPLTEDEEHRLKQALFISAGGASLHRVREALIQALAEIEEERRLVAIGRDFYCQLQKLPGVRVSLHSDPLVDQWGWMSQAQRMEYGRMADRLRGK